MSKSRILNVSNMSFNAIPENKILAKNFRIYSITPAKLHSHGVSLMDQEGSAFDVITYPEMSQEFQDEGYSVTMERKFLQQKLCLQATLGSP